MNKIDSNNHNYVYVYILKCFYGNENEYIYYKGITNDMMRRLREHKDGKSNYTKRFHGNISLVHIEIWENRSNAMRREHELKKMSRKELEEIICQ